MLEMSYILNLGQLFQIMSNNKKYLNIDTIKKPHFVTSIFYFKIIINDYQN
jgi:hypothetical protein